LCVHHARSGVKENKVALGHKRKSQMLNATEVTVNGVRELKIAFL